MKGVAFIGGEGPEARVSRDLCRDAELVVAADSGLSCAEAAGVIPDWITGDMDSLEDTALLDKYPADRVLREPVDKDFTDTELACKLLFDRGCTDIVMIGGGGGRMAHIFALFAMFEREKRPSRWRTAHEDIFLVERNMHFDVKAGTVISLFPVGSGPWKAASVNLKWKLDGLSWHRGSFGVSNIALERNIVVDPASGSFLVIFEVGPNK